MYSVIIKYNQLTTASLVELEELSSDIERLQYFKLCVLRRLDETTALEQVRNNTAEIFLWLVKSFNILLYCTLFASNFLNQYLSNRICMGESPIC